MLLKPVERRLAVLDTRLEALVESIHRVGLANVAWPPVIGAFFGITLTSLWPGLPALVHKKFGLGITVGLAAIAALGACALLARRSSWTEAAAFVRRAGLPVGVVLVLTLLHTGLEKEHEFLVLGVAGFGGWVLARWVAEWAVHRNAASVGSGAADPEQQGVAPPVESNASALVARVVLSGLVLAYTVGLSTLALRNHWAFNTNRADLGIYVSIFRRSSLGDFLGCTICGGGDHLSGHFDPILVLLSPLYLIYPEAETVLALQALALGSGMVPLYLLCMHYGLGRLVALLLCVSYGLHPALHGINLYDFHSLALLVPVALWLLWARDTGRIALYFAFFGIALFVREDVALVSIVIGADTILMRRKHAALIGLTTILVAGVYFVAVKGLLMRGADPLGTNMGRGYGYFYADLVPKGTGTAGLVNSVLGRPATLLAVIAKQDKLYYWLVLLVPVAFLPLLAQRGRLLLCYGAAFTLLASRPYLYSPHFQYSAVVIPFLYYLTAGGLLRAPEIAPWLAMPAGLRPLQARLVLAVLVLGTTALCSWRLGGIVPNHSFRAGFNPLDRNPKPIDFERDAYLKEICRKLPAGSSIAADGPYLPHLGRCHAYYVKQKRDQADYLVWRFNKGKTSKEIKREVKQGKWKLLEKRHQLSLFENVKRAKQARASEVNEMNEVNEVNE